MTMGAPVQELKLPELGAVAARNSQVCDRAGARVELWTSRDTVTVTFSPGQKSASGLKLIWLATGLE